MNINKGTSKEGMKWRCREHPKVPCDLICLDGDAKDRVVCFNCVQQNQIPYSNLISMSYVLAANEQDILETYPPLNDQQFSRKLKVVNLQQLLEDIEGYFKKLRDDFEREVKAAEQRAKEALIKQEKVYSDLLEGYIRIAEVQKLKKLIVSEKQSAEQDLDSFIKDKWSKADENRKIMSDLINQYEGEQQFSFEGSNRIAQEIIQSLKKIDFFQQSNSKQEITLIKSTFQTSQFLEISKVGNSIYQVNKQRANNDWFDQVFIDPIIDPSKMYILKIELESRNGENGFFFGLAKDQGKDNNCAHSQNMCYFDNSNNYGITKYIKGSPMQQGKKDAAGKRSFEVRIYLYEKFLRVACLPNYSSIVELDDPNKIDPKVAYRFFLSMLQQGDIMRITNFRTVSKFDGNM